MLRWLSTRECWGATCPSTPPSRRFSACESADLASETSKLAAPAALASFIEVRPFDKRLLTFAIGAGIAFLVVFLLVWRLTRRRKPAKG